MGQSQSSISPKKSYYSVEYLNADFEQELNKIARKSKETEIGDFSVAKKSSSSCVSRSKSFARPENRVLPPLFQKKQLRKTNLLKTDGSRKTWRNNAKLRKSNSTILSSDSPKPGLIRTWLTKSVQNLNRDCDLSSLDSLDQDVNLVDNRKLSNEPQIRVISQFPIDSKVYRHYISGKNVDKLNRSVQASSFIQPVYFKDLEPTYDSIHEFRSKNSNSASSLNSTSTFSSITKSSDLFYGDSNRKYAQDSLNSSVFSALTSSSMYKNDPCSDQDFSSSHFSSGSNDYDFLSNTNSGLKKNGKFYKQIPQTSFKFRVTTS
ncbi:hypothetical protein BpHYR1_004596 [Brachionus plicatilis]|uniref:Uncharacterized protein n=1 Tax=Brachionus plicatilis TaxID=10195 RepID=A0A3M7PBY0_BRAPC|nr:hypothetical protein BpHYR1_004596 [Brachionus plicatilis]